MNTSYARKDWSELTHAYGSAEDVPNLLADLNSQDEQVRENASSELFATIWHQGTVYPATVKALPELVTLFKSPTCADRDLVALLLASIANGDGYYHVHAQIDSLRSTFEESLRKRGSSIANEMEKEADYLSVMREMALEFLPLLEPYIDSPNPNTREAVATAFPRYFANFPRFKSLLQHRLAVEPDDDVRACIQRLLGEIGQPNLGQ